MSSLNLPQKAAVEYADALKALAARDKNVENYITKVADAIANAARASASADPNTARSLLRLLKSLKRTHPAVAELDATLGG